MGAGVSAADLVEAACELQALLSHRASFGLGPLLHAQPYFSAGNAPGAQRHPRTPFLGPSTPILQVLMLASGAKRCRMPWS